MFDGLSPPSHIPQTDVMNDTDWLIAVYQYPHTYCCCQQKPPMCGKERGKTLQEEQKKFKI